MRKGLGALKCRVFLAADQIVGLILFNSQPQAYWPSVCFV